MIGFRVFGLPRSGTGWVSNWLTTDRTHCWHDPCEAAEPDQIDSWGGLVSSSGKVPGVSCTGSWRHRFWRCDAPTIKLIRPIGEIQQALEHIRLPRLSDELITGFSALEYPEFTLSDLMLPGVAESVWNMLIPGIEHNRLRHMALTRLNVQVTEYELGRVRRAVARAG